jgi:hypothetical protein
MAARLERLRPLSGDDCGPGEGFWIAFIWVALDLAARNVFTEA